MNTELQIYCPYCENPDAFGLLPATEVSFGTTSRWVPSDYGTRTKVSSLVHPEKNGPRIMAGVRCYKDQNALLRVVENSAITTEDAACSPVTEANGTQLVF